MNAEERAATIDLSPRRLSGTDLEIGRSVLGTMTFGTQLDERESERIVHRARDLGVTVFDTANTYSDGRSEEILGRIIGPFRDEIQVATKVGSTLGSGLPSRCNGTNRSSRPEGVCRRSPTTQG